MIRSGRAGEGKSLACFSASARAKRGLWADLNQIKFPISTRSSRLQGPDAVDVHQRDELNAIGRGIGQREVGAG